jgi:hypothetical protein
LKIYNKYIISLAIASAIINTLLAFFDQNDLMVYFAANIFACLAITLLYLPINPKARRALNKAAFVYFAGFIVAIAFKTVEILSGG